MLGFQVFGAGKAWGQSKMEWFFLDDVDIIECFDGA
jgi:hypothetical protein